MEENKKEVKVPKLKENYMEILKNGIMEKKNAINSMQRTVNEIRQKI